MEEESYRLDGSVRLKPEQLPCEMFEKFQKDTSEEEEGDSSVHIEAEAHGLKGEITVYNKDAAIKLISSLMEQFNISSNELNIY